MKKMWLSLGLKLVGVLSLVVLVTLLLAYAMRDRDRGVRALGESFEYDLNDLKQVPSELIVGRQVATWPIELTAAGSIVAADGNIVVGGSDGWRILDESGALVTNRTVTAPISALAVDDKEFFVASGNRISRFDIRAPDEPVSQWQVPDEDPILTSMVVIEDDVFVANASAAVVYRFAREGRIVGEIGRRKIDSGEPGFIIPSPYFDLAVGYDDTLWVVDPGRHELVNYSLDGRRISSWGKAAMRPEGFSGCCNPTHIVLRPDGTFVTSEKGIVRVKLYNQAGELLGVIAPPRSFEDRNGALDLAVDSQGRILVLDPNRKSVRVFVVDEDFRSEGLKTAGGRNGSA